MRQFDEPTKLTPEQRAAMDDYFFELELFEKYELPLLYKHLEAEGVTPHQALLAFKKWTDEHYLYKGHTPIEIAQKKYNLLGTCENCTTEHLAHAILKCIGATTL